MGKGLDVMKMEEGNDRERSNVKTMQSDDVGEY